MQEACGDAYMRRAAVQTGEAWPVNGGKACGKPDIAFQGPREEHNLVSYSGELFGVLFSSFVANQTQCIVEKTTVPVVVSYFEHIFIIIYSYIPLYSILYVPFTYFYNYMVFSCFENFIYFYHY